MTLNIKGAGITISQPAPEIIKVDDSIGSARILGAIMFVGGALLAWSNAGRMLDITFIFGVLLALSGAALTTQRYVMTLSKLKGTWSYEGDIFFVLSFKKSGLIASLGPVQIRKRIMSRENRMGEPFITYPVFVKAHRLNGGEVELSFGQHWSLEEAHDLSDRLARFLGKSIVDKSNEESK